MVTIELSGEKFFFPVGRAVDASHFQRLRGYFMKIPGGRDLYYKYHYRHFLLLGMDSSCQKRLTKEFQQLTLEPPAGVHVKDDSTTDLRLWTVNVDGAPNTLYAGEQFTLRVFSCFA